jgi:hypothetical protein
MGLFFRLFCKDEAAFTVPPVCEDCKWYRPLDNCPPHFAKCVNPSAKENKGGVNHLVSRVPVVSMEAFWDCGNLREKGRSCGPSGSLFEGKDKPREVTQDERLLNRIKCVEGSFGSLERQFNACSGGVSQLAARVSALEASAAPKKAKK